MLNGILMQESIIMQPSGYNIVLRADIRLP